MRQRIMLASVMLLKPKLLIADEPTTALDTLSQREVLDLMVELARDHGHRDAPHHPQSRPGVRAMPRRCVVLEKGRLVETGPTGAGADSPLDAYTRRLVGSRPRPCA